MRRILFVSCNYSHDFSKMTWGTYIRMQILLQGARAAADLLDVLFIVAADIPGKVDPAVVAASLKDHWGIDARVRFALRSPEPRGRVIPWLRSLFDFAAQVSYRRSSGPLQTAAVAAAIEADTDLIVIHRLDAALACIRAARIARVPVAINLDTIEHVEMQRRFAKQPLAAKLMNAAEFIRLSTLKRAELDIFAQADCLLVCSQLENDQLVREGVRSRIAIIPNARDFIVDRETSSAQEMGDTLMFFGSYGYPPNEQAAEEMINDIFPRVRKVRPHARLLIAGNLADRLPSYGKAGPGVELLSDVADVADVYRRTTVVCCPIRVGAGTRIKLIEASSWKKAIVSTLIGAEGLDLIDGEHILLRDDPQAFADACVRLLDDAALRERLGAAAFERARGEYDRPRVVERIVTALERATSKP